MLCCATYAILTLVISSNWLGKGVALTLLKHHRVCFPIHVSNLYPLFECLPVYLSPVHSMSVDVKAMQTTSTACNGKDLKVVNVLIWLCCRGKNTMSLGP